jgi:hypothetical protein
MSELIQEQGISTPRTYTHCMRCRRSFKRSKTIPYGPTCARKMAAKEAAVANTTNEKLA